MKPKSKKQNRHQDLTMVNLDALKKQLNQLSYLYEQLDLRVGSIEEALSDFLKVSAGDERRLKTLERLRFRK